MRLVGKSRYSSRATATMAGGGRYRYDAQRTMLRVARWQATASAAQRRSPGMSNSRNNRVQYRCSFCGKGQEEVRRLIAGPGAVYICDECVELCREIIDEEEAPAAKRVPSISRIPTPKTHLRAAQPVRHRPGARQEDALRRRLQPLQAHQRRDAGRRRRRAAEEQHPAGRPDRLRQDAAGADAGPASSMCPSPSPTPPR